MGFNLQEVIEGLKERCPDVTKLERQPIYRKNDYLALIKKHYKECGLPEPEWLDEIPDYTPPPPRDASDTEPNLFSHNWITLVLEYDEDRGYVKCRISAALQDLHRDHYSQGIPPPIEKLVRAYKDLGFSDKFLMNMISKHDRRLAMMKKCSAKLDAIFKIDSAPKKKKTKKERREVVQESDQEEEEDEEEEEEDSPGDDALFDMEVDEDDDENNEDVDEDDYISD
tara:strand:- start:3031 stop:3708 length:678 start_codon:yes stop_codon:yes gene_type:complete